MLLINFIHFLMTAITTPSFAHCPNSFTFNDQTFCADFEWEKTDILKGKSLMSPVLNSSAQKPFEQHLSKFWLNIWASGDTNHKVLFFEDLEIDPFMLMSHIPHHGGELKGDIKFVKDRGYFISGVNFVKMQGCWSIAIENDQFFHLILIAHFKNLDEKQNFEQNKLCTLLHEEFLAEDLIKSHNHLNDSDHSKH